MAQLSSEQLAASLRDMARAIELGDSFEGNLAYSFGSGPDTFTVRAARPVGNSMGQGGMRLVELAEGEEL